MSRSQQNKNFGHHASSSQPGVATPTKLRAWGASGVGVAGEFQRQVNRMFRTTEEHVRPMPHIVHVEDVFKGLNLDTETEGKLRTVLQGTRSDFGASSKLRVPRVVHARIRLMDTMRAMKHIESTTRMEILRRAQSYWKRNHPDYDQPTTIRYVARKSMKPNLMKAKKPPTGDSDEDGVPNALDEDPSKKGEGPSEVKGSQEDAGEDGQKPKGEGPAHPKDRRPQSDHDGKFNELPPEQQVQLIQQALQSGAISEEDAHAAMDEIEHGQAVDDPIVSAVEAMDEKEVDGGRMLDFGEDVQAHLPDDADFHHHATEYAKHRAAYQIHKDKDPKKADAHKHAANIHASVGNAMHQAGDLERRRLPGSKGDGKAESLQSAEDQAANGGMETNPDMGEPEDLPMPGGPLGTNGPGGGPPTGNGGKAKPPGLDIPSPRDDITGGEQPGMPDQQRNVPGRDSDIEIAQKMSGKLRQLMGKMTGKVDPTGQAPQHIRERTRREAAARQPGQAPQHIRDRTMREAATRRNPGQAPQHIRERTMREAASRRSPLGKAGRALTSAERTVAHADAVRAMKPEYPEPMTGKQGPGHRAVRAARPTRSRARVTALHPHAEDVTSRHRGRPPAPISRRQETGLDRQHRRYKESMQMGREAAERQRMARHTPPEDRPHPGAEAAVRRARMEGRANPSLFVMVGKQQHQMGTPVPRRFRARDLTQAEAESQRARAGSSIQARIQEFQRRFGWGPEGRRTTVSGEERAAERGIGGQTVRQQEQGPRQGPQPRAKRLAPRPEQPAAPAGATETTNVVQLPEVRIQARSQRGRGQRRSRAQAAPQAAPGAQVSTSAARQRGGAAAAPQAPAPAQTGQTPAQQAPAPQAAPQGQQAGPTTRARSILDRMAGQATGELLRSLPSHFTLVKGKKQPWAGGFSRQEAMRAAKRLGIDWGRVKFRKSAFIEGMNHEREHGKVSHDATTIAQIALDHLREDPKYYSKLKRIEKSKRGVRFVTGEIPYTWE